MKKLNKEFFRDYEGECRGKGVEPTQEGFNAWMVEQMKQTLRNAYDDAMNKSMDESNPSRTYYVGLSEAYNVALNTMLEMDAVKSRLGDYK